MRLTIETTDSGPAYSRKVSIDFPYDDIALVDLIVEIESLLIAYGFSHDNVKECFEGNDEM